MYPASLHRLMMVRSMIYRQKIDEAPTPFRYGSESDQSEAESGSSDGEHLTRRRKVSAGSFDQANPDPDTVTNTANNSQAASHLAQKYAQHSVLYQWEAVHAKLTYEKHLQDLEQQQQQQQQQLSNADPQATMMVCDDGPDVALPPPPPMQAYPFPSLTAISYDDNTVGDEGDGHDDDDDMGFDPPTTDFGELVSSPTAHGTAMLVPPPPSSSLPPAHGGKPVRPALKSSSLMLATGASPTKLSMKRSSSQELQLQLQQQQHQQHQQLLQLGTKPHKHVHIRTQLSTTLSNVDTSSPDTPTVGVAFPSSSSAMGLTGLGQNATTPTYASVVSTGGNNAYFRYSNPEGYHTTQHSALFAGINASMGGGHDRDLLGDDDDDDDGDVDSEKKSSTTLHRRISEEMQPAPSHDAQALQGGDLGAGSGEKQQFRNKRAGHYNEYKVLMAMRAKMMAEDDEDDEDDD